MSQDRNSEPPADERPRLWLVAEAVWALLSVVVAGVLMAPGPQPGVALIAAGPPSRPASTPAPSVVRSASREPAETAPDVWVLASGAPRRWPSTPDAEAAAAATVEAPPQEAAASAAQVADLRGGAAQDRMDPGPPADGPKICSPAAAPRRLDLHYDPAVNAPALDIPPAGPAQAQERRMRLSVLLADVLSR